MSARKIRIQHKFSYHRKEPGFQKMVIMVVLLFVVIFFISWLSFLASSHNKTSPGNNPGVEQSVG